ncbi:hypothetical protein AB2F75_24220 (plasmid) [Escherichia coli]
MAISKALTPLYTPLKQVATYAPYLVAESLTIKSLQNYIISNQRLTRRRFQDMRWIWRLRTLLPVADAMGSAFTAIYEPNNKVREIAKEDYGFSEDNLFGTSKNFALYLPMSRI